jgi:hypothetical protein
LISPISVPDFLHCVHNFSNASSLNNQPKLINFNDFCKNIKKAKLFSLHNTFVTVK